MSLIVLAGLRQRGRWQGIRWAVKRGRPALPPAPVEEHGPTPEPAPTFTMGQLVDQGAMLHLAAGKATMQDWITPP